MTNDELSEKLDELVNNGGSITNAIEWGSSSTSERKEITMIKAEIMDEVEALRSTNRETKAQLDIATNLVQAWIEESQRLHSALADLVAMAAEVIYDGPYEDVVARAREALKGGK